jgi:hypothetical protein
MLVSVLKPKYTKFRDFGIIGYSKKLPKKRWSQFFIKIYRNLFRSKILLLRSFALTAATLLAATLIIVSADLGQILAVITAASVADNQQTRYDELWFERSHYQQGGHQISATKWHHRLPDRIWRFCDKGTCKRNGNYHG